MRCKNCLTEIDGAVCPNCGTPAPELSEIEQNEIDEMEEAFWRSIREPEAEAEEETKPEEPSEMEEPSELRELSEPEEPSELMEPPELEEAEAEGMPEQTEPEAEETSEIEAEPEGESPQRGEYAADKLWEAVELDEPSPATESEPEPAAVLPLRDDMEPDRIENGAAQTVPQEDAQEDSPADEREADMLWGMAHVQERRAKHAEWIRQRKRYNRKYLVGLLLAAAVIILLLVLIWGGFVGKNQSITQAAYISDDHTLYLAASNQMKPEEIAKQVETLIGYNAAAGIYLYLNCSDELIYQNGETLYCIGSGIPQYDIYTDSALQTVAYVLYDKTAMTYDAYVWTQAMETPLQIEYSVPYVEHFRFREDGKYVVYNMQNMAGSHMIKLLDIDKAESKSSSVNTVFLAGNSYLACYALCMDGNVLYYDYERGGMYLSDGAQTLEVTGALADVLLLEDDGMLCYMQSDGQVYIKEYESENAAVQLVCGETYRFENIEMIYDSSGAPAMLVLKEDEWYYGIPYAQLQTLMKQPETEPAYLQITVAAEEPFLLQSDGTSLFYLENGSLKAVGMPDSGFSEAVTLAEDIDTYGLTSGGRAFWLSEGTLYAAGIESGAPLEIMDGVDYFQLAATHVYIHTNAGELLLLRSAKSDTPVVLDEDMGESTKIVTGVQ